MHEYGLITPPVTASVKRAVALAIVAAAYLSAAALVVLAWPEPEAPPPPSAPLPSQDVRQPYLPDDVRDVLPDYVEYPGLLPDHSLNEIYVICRSPAVHIPEAKGALYESGGDVDKAIELANEGFAASPFHTTDSGCYWQCILQGWNRTSCDPVHAPIALPCSLEDRGQCRWASCTQVRDGNTTYCGYTQPAPESHVVRWMPLDADAASKREQLQQERDSPREPARSPR